jgi:hypothetical protein
MFLDTDLINQKRDIELFNNVGNFDNVEGRLTVWLAISQTPRVHWEFEVARGEYNLDSLTLSPQKLTSWSGSNPQLVIDKPTVTFCGGARKQIRGYAEQALYGDINIGAHYFDFYLPNTDFMREATGGNLAATMQALDSKSFIVEINNDWSVELSPELQNRGSMITLKVRLFQTKQPSAKVQDLLKISLADANKIISDLCLMLSYINGGYVKSVYGIAKKFIKNDNDRISIEYVAALAETPLILPQEELGQSCIRHFGINDLLSFIRCFPAFQAMLNTVYWREKWVVLLEWYFQAIPRLTGRRRNVLLPVVANALGALLENLARIILFDEEKILTEECSKYLKVIKTQNPKRNLTLKERINLLLHCMCTSDQELVNNFVDIRNNSTHATSKKLSLTPIQQWEVVWKTVQWVDEIILWRIGYAGEFYRDRGLKTVGGIKPHYNLSSRNPIW